MDLFSGDLTTPSNVLCNKNIAGNTSAILILFSPRIIPDQTRRSYTYKFGEGFKSSLFDRIDAGLKGVPQNNIGSFMLDCPDARGAILPEARGQNINLKTFSNYWTFVLIVDNDTPLGGKNFPTVMPSRTLYTGWCTGEPVTKKNFSSGHVLNEGCVLAVTHQTVLNMKQTFGYTGGYQGVDVMGDYDFAAGTVLQNMQNSSEAVYDLNPGTVVQSVIPSQDMDGLIQVTSQAVAAKPKSLVIPTELNDPAQHLSHLVSQAVQTAKVTANGFGYNGTPDFDIFSGGDTIMSTFGSLLGCATPSLISSLHPDQPFTIGEVVQKYPDLQFQVSYIPAESQYDITSSAGVSARNVYTTILYSALPGILVQYGLSEIAFRYNSYTREAGGLGSIGDERGMFQLQNIASLYVCNQNELYAKWDSLQTYLKMTLFPIIKDTVGDFDLMVHCAVGGVSLINLNLFNFTAEQGFIETNNLLGGLNTSTVGEQGELTNNATQLYSMMSDLSQQQQSLRPVNFTF